MATSVGSELALGYSISSETMGLHGIRKFGRAQQPISRETFRSAPDVAFSSQAYAHRRGEVTEFQKCTEFEVVQRLRKWGQMSDPIQRGAPPLEPGVATVTMWTLCPSARSHWGPRKYRAWGLPRTRKMGTDIRSNKMWDRVHPPDVIT